MSFDKSSINHVNVKQAQQSKVEEISTNLGFKVPDLPTAGAQELPFDTAITLIEHYQPDLAKAMKALSPDRRLKLFYLPYRYAETIFDAAQFFVKTPRGNYLPANDQKLTPDQHDLREQLAPYSGIPLGIVINKAVEERVCAYGHAVPRQVLFPGDVMGLESIAPIGSINTSQKVLYSGVRSLYSLSSIGECKANQRLSKHFKIAIDPPTSLEKQARVFTAIAKSKAFNSDWQSGLLVFGYSWLHALNDPAFQPFFNALIAIYLKQSNFSRTYNDFSYHYQTLRNQVYRHFDINTVTIAKQLLMIAAGSCPGLSLAFDDALAPISRLNTIYQTIYQLPDYDTHFMQLNVRRKNLRTPLYYSLAVPGQLEHHPLAGRSGSQMQHIALLKELVEGLFSSIKKRVNLAPLDPLCDLLMQNKFSFYHTQENQEADILPADKMRLFEPHKLHYKSSLFKGVVRVSATSKD